MKLISTYDKLAPFYDDDMGRNIGQEDLPIYLSYSLRAQPVLELGCGTGRIMQALVAEGMEVIGIDNSQAMLDQAAKKLAPYDSNLWRLHRGDLAGFETPCGFGTAICAFSTYSKLLSKKEQHGFFSSVRRALVSDGTLVMEMFVQGRDFDVLPEGKPLVDYRDRPVNGGALSRVKTIYRDVEPQVNKIVLKYTFEDKKGRESSFEVEDFTRYSPPEELMDTAAQCGLTVTNIYGSYKKTPYVRGNKAMIIEAKRR